MYNIYAFEHELFAFECVSCICHTNASRCCVRHHKLNSIPGKTPEQNYLYFWIWSFSSFYQIHFWLAFKVYNFDDDVESDQINCMKYEMFYQILIRENILWEILYFLLQSADQMSIQMNEHRCSLFYSMYFFFNLQKLRYMHVKTFYHF